jgi:hypothetical protein
MEVRLTLTFPLEDLPELSEALRDFSLRPSRDAPTTSAIAPRTTGDGGTALASISAEWEWVATAFSNAIPEAQKVAAWLATTPTTIPPSTYTYDDLGEGADLPYDRDEHGDDRVGPSLQSLRIQARKADPSFTLVEKRRDSRTNRYRYWMRPEVAAVIRGVIGASENDVG